MEGAGTRKVALTWKKRKTSTSILRWQQLLMLAKASWGQASLFFCDMALLNLHEDSNSSSDSSSASNSMPTSEKVTYVGTPKLWTHDGRTQHFILFMDQEKQRDKETLVLSLDTGETEQWSDSHVLIHTFEQSRKPVKRNLDILLRFKRQKKTLDL